MSISPLLSALNRKLVLPKLGLSVTFILGFSRSINNLYILMRMSGSLPILPAITTFCVAGENEICVKPSAPKTAASARASGNLRRDFCKRPMMPLTPTASSAASNAPVNVIVMLLRSMPSRIRLPKPPAPIKAPSVAVPIISTAAVRMPEIIAGSAMGNSIRHSDCQRDRPNAV